MEEIQEVKLSRAEAIEMQDLLIAQYSQDEFQRDLYNVTKAAGNDAVTKRQSTTALMLPIQIPIVEQFGFPGNATGVQQSVRALRPLLNSDPDIAAKSELLATLISIDAQVAKGTQLYDPKARSVAEMQMLVGEKVQLLEGGEEDVLVHPDMGPAVYGPTGEPSFMTMRWESITGKTFFGERMRDVSGGDNKKPLKEWPGCTSSERSVLLHQAAKKNRKLREWKGEDYVQGQREIVEARILSTARSRPDAEEDDDNAEWGEPADDYFDVQVDQTLVLQLKQSFTEKDKAGFFDLYAPKYKVMGFPLTKVRFRVLCFHLAGGAESMFTGPNTPFLNWVKEESCVEVIAFDFPGRDKLRSHKKFTSAAALANDLLAVVFDKLKNSRNIPYVIWGHSVGTWVAFEFMQLVRKAGLPEPSAALMMAFPAPHMPKAMRTWRRSKTLDDASMREELTNWDQAHFTGSGKVVFNDPDWKDTWEPLMRADFQLFDEYIFRHNGSPKFKFPIHAWHFDGEHFNSAYMVQMWVAWTSADFEFRVMEDMGHLTCVYKPDMKKRYFEAVVEVLKTYSAPATG